MRRSPLLFFPLLALALGCGGKDTEELEKKLKHAEAQNATLEAELNTFRAAKKAELAARIVGNWGATDPHGSIRGLKVRAEGQADLSLPGQDIVTGNYLLVGSTFEIRTNVPKAVPLRFDIVSVTETEMEIRRDDEETVQKLKRM